MQQERQAAIDRQNQVIVTQLMKIKQSPARVDNWNTQWKPRFCLLLDQLLTDWLIDWLTDWLTDCLSVWFAGLLTELTVSMTYWMVCLTDRLTEGVWTDWLTDWLNEWAVWLTTCNWFIELSQTGWWTYRPMDWQTDRLTYWLIDPLINEWDLKIPIFWKLGNLGNPNLTYPYFQTSLTGEQSVFRKNILEYNNL